MNILDQVIGFFSPAKGLKRAENRTRMEILSQYGRFLGASTTERSLKRWLPGFQTDPNLQTPRELQLLRSRSRDAYENNPIARSAIDTISNGAICPGLKLQSTIERDYLGLDQGAAQKVQATIEREFSIFSSECDITRNLKFNRMQELIFLSALTAGDVFTVFRHQSRPGAVYDLRLQVIEAERVGTPLNRKAGLREVEVHHYGPPDTTVRVMTDKIIGGVEADDNGAPAAYWVADPSSKFRGVVSKHRRIPAYGARTGLPNVIHTYRQYRPGQRRGVPILAPVLERLRMLNEYERSENMAAAVAGMFTVFLKTPEDIQRKILDPESDDESDDIPDYKLGYGLINHLMPGYDVQFANPGRPNNAFEPFVLANLQGIGAALGVPLEMLTKHFRSSYSAARAAFLEAWRAFRNWQQWMIEAWCQPVFERWLWEAVAVGRVPAPGFLTDPGVRWAYSQAEWIAPAMGQIDELKEVTAAEKRLKLPITTLTDETRKLTGRDWDKVIERYRQEIERVNTVRQAHQEHDLEAADAG